MMMHVSPAVFDRLEKRYWRDPWHTICWEGWCEQRVDVVRFGPIQASVVMEEPEVPALNLLLGAGAPEAVEHGHLADALSWAESHGLDYRVPVTPGQAGTAMAERCLVESGHEQGESRVKLVRDLSPLELPEPRGIEVERREPPNEDDGFPEQMADFHGLSIWGTTLFYDLPGTKGWICEVAYDDHGAFAYLAMLIDGAAAIATIAPRPWQARSEEGSLLLIQRCIAAARRAGCEVLFADLPAPRPSSGEDGDPPPPSPEAQLRQAGFRQAFVRSDWRPPRHAVRTTTRWDSWA